MADITAFQSGDVSDEGLQNWRGDQTTVAPGHSIFKSSSVQLAPLGSRKVVGDRVFRYAQLGAIAANAGDVLQYPGNVAAFAQLNVTAGASNPAGDKVFTLYSTTNRAVDYFADGYVWAQSGTAANLGMMYRVKSHAALNITTNNNITLYDALEIVPNTADSWSIVRNPYKLVTQNTAGTAPSAGVLVCPATTNDYVWIQTWGPCAVKASTAAGGGNVAFAAATGAAVGQVGTDGTAKVPIGSFYRVAVASERELVFLTIAP